jgi:Tol biopolymer transport system component/predicted Ser/Thr protein kinase
VERWQQIESLFQQALQHDPAQRESYLRDACRGDSDLLREVSSLLLHHYEAGGFGPWAARAAAQLINAPPALQPGQSLGPHRIECFLAAGGMGEVYRAIDTRLNRPVAIKVSAERFSERFEREARVIASLNHPNICTLYDVGANYLVMEYVEGPTLGERIARGPIPLAEALEIARQVAAALEEAHQRLVVHRDLKPDNVKIKPDGTVKVLDFGLAKLPAAPAAPSGNVTDSPTLTLAATRGGVLLGTVAYMSPEQARGEPVDKRSDVWAFGAVLWEMLTGRQLFQGKTTSDVLAAVIRDEPDLGQAPAKVRPLLKRCLEKDPQKRLRDIGDTMGIIESTQEAAEVRTNPLPWVAGALLLAALAALSWVHFREAPLEVRAITASIEPPENTEFEFPYGTGPGLCPPALSPDGRWIVFRARGADGKVQLWVRELDSPAARSLAGTEEALYPFWSPDNRSIAFFAGGKLKRMEITGGPAVTLAEAPSPAGGSWSAEGTIVFGAVLSGPLQRVPESGGVPKAARKIEPGHDCFPWFLPDGHHFVFTTRTQETGEPMLRIGSLDSGDAKTIGPVSNLNVAYSSGHLLFLREYTLMAQPFDPKRLAVSGAAVPLAERVRSILPAGGTVGIFSASREGMLAYQTGPAGSLELTWFDRGGRSLGTLGDPGDIWSVDFSPDYKRVAITSRGQNDDIWIYEVARGSATRFTFSPASERDPIWSPDGRSLVYFSNAKGRWDLYRKTVDGTGTEELLYADEASKVASSWSPDGKFLLYFRLGPKTRTTAIWVLPVGSGLGPGTVPKPFPWTSAATHETNPKFSSDGHWVAYQSDESGRPEIFVARFPEASGKRLISNGGGSYPRWRADGREIFYELNGTLMAAGVSIQGGSVEVGAIRSLRIPITFPHYRYDVTADGQRFLVATPRGPKSPAPLTLIQNWTALLKKK